MRGATEGDEAPTVARAEAKRYGRTDPGRCRKDRRRGRATRKNLPFVKSERVHEAGVIVVDVVEGFGGSGGRGPASGAT
jgi:hypothetical protein